jgi:hypothetical protein
MQHSQAHEPLARLLAIESYSLPIYLQTAAPWARLGEERALETLSHIAADQRRLAGLIARRLERLEGHVPRGDFPQRFTWLNDLSLDYLLRLLIDEQQRDIKTIEDCIAKLTADRHSLSLAEEALGAARAHLESLEELAGEK